MDSRERKRVSSLMRQWAGGPDESKESLAGGAPSSAGQAVHDSHARNFFFDSLVTLLWDEIEVHGLRVGFPEGERVWPQACDIAREYIVSLRDHRHDPLSWRAAFVKAKAALGQEPLVSYLHWDPLEFLVATPLRLESRIHPLLQKEREALIARSRHYSDFFSIGPRGQVVVPNSQNPRELKKEQANIHMRLDALERLAGSSIFDIPSYLIITAVEIDELCGPRDVEEEREYCGTYRPFFERGIMEGRDAYKKGDKRIGDYQARMGSYARELTEAMGDLLKMGTVIRQHLQSNTDAHGCNPREFYVDPFLAKVTIGQFPSAEADFIAAYVIACALDENPDLKIPRLTRYFF